MFDKHNPNTYGYYGHLMVLHHRALDKFNLILYCVCWVVLFYDSMPFLGAH